MDVTDRRVAEKFAAFAQEHDPTLVDEAWEAVEAVARGVPAGDAAALDGAVSRWLQFLAMLDGAIDPHWDPKDVPVRGATPPPAHGIVHPSGEVDPSTIPDPVARAHYESALQAARDQDLWYRTQFQLRRTEERTMLFLGRLLAEDYTGLAPRQRFERLLAASPVSEARKERVRALMPGT